MSTLPQRASVALRQEVTTLFFALFILLFLQDAVYNRLGSSNGKFISLVDTLRSVAQYRSGLPRETRGTMSSLRMVVITLSSVLVKFASSCVVSLMLGKVPVVFSGPRHITFFFIGFGLIWCSPNDIVYRTMESSRAVRLLVHMGGGLYKMRKVIFAVEAATSANATFPFALLVSVLAVDGTTLTRRALHWVEGRFVVPHTLHRKRFHARRGSGHSSHNNSNNNSSTNSTTNSSSNSGSNSNTSAVSTNSGASSRSSSSGSGGGKTCKKAKVQLSKSALAKISSSSNSNSRSNSSNSRNDKLASDSGLTKISSNSKLASDSSPSSSFREFLAFARPKKTLSGTLCDWGRAGGRGAKTTLLTTVLPLTVVTALVWLAAHDAWVTGISDDSFLNLRAALLALFIWRAGGLDELSRIHGESMYAAEQAQDLRRFVGTPHGKAKVL